MRVFPSQNPQREDGKVCDDDIKTRILPQFRNHLLHLLRIHLLIIFQRRNRLALMPIPHTSAPESHAHSQYRMTLTSTASRPRHKDPADSPASCPCNLVHVHLRRMMLQRNRGHRPAHKTTLRPLRTLNRQRRPLHRHRNFHQPIPSDFTRIV
jgi:hypothetical protein